MRRPLVHFTFAAAISHAVLAAGCNNNGADIVFGDFSASRTADGRVSVDMEVIGSEGGGRAVGDFCVSATWFSPGTELTFVPVASSYSGDSRTLDSVLQCTVGDGVDPLRDGDHRTFRLVSNRTDIPVGVPLRIQAMMGGVTDNKDWTSP